MGEDLRNEAAVDELLEDNHPSCIGGILHALDYHSWHYNVKKMLLLPYKKQHGPRKAKGNGRSKMRMNVRDSDEVQNLLDAKADNFLIDLRNTKTSSTNKRSLKARIKALISEEISKEKSCRQRGSGFPGGSCLQRTYSIHHLESLDHGSQRKITGLSHESCSPHSSADRNNAATKLDDKGHMESTKEAIAFDEKFTSNVVDYMKHKKLSEMCEKEKKDSANQKPVDANEQSRKASESQCKECTDILETFSVNKDLFLKILQDTDDGITNHFFNFKASNPRTRLSKSGSFPSTDLSRTNNFRRSKLEDKQNEVWSFPKGEKLFAEAPAPKLVASKFPKDLYTKSDLAMADDTAGAVGNQDESFSPTDSTPTHGLDKEGRNKVLVDPVYEINSTTEYALGEHNKESRSCYEIGGSAYDLSKSTPTHRRTFSANESLARYAQLFHNSFGGEAEFHHSKSLKLKNEYEIPSGGHASTSFKRVRSLPHLNSYFSLHSEPSCDAQLSGIPTRTVVDSSKNVENGCQDEPKPVNLFIPDKETECPHHVVENSCPKEHLARFTESTNECATADRLGVGEEMDRQINGEINSDIEQEITFSEVANNKLPQPSPGSILRSRFQEDLTYSADFPTSEGLECRDNYVDEKEYLLDSQYESCSDTLSEKFEIANKSDKNNCHIELPANKDADFNYVIDILERSGFVENGFLGPWHSLDQPLNPSAFEEAEARWPHEPQCPGKEIHPCCQHHLLFDLTNEVLLQIYDSSFTYYPRALSLNCRVPPVPVKYNVVEEVWARMSKTLSSSRTAWEDASVDCVVAQDLGKDDGWMNLQSETECVALELEDMIFDELLEEIFCS